MEDDVQNEYLHEKQKIELINISINLYLKKENNLFSFLRKKYKLQNKKKFLNIKWTYSPFENIMQRN